MDIVADVLLFCGAIGACLYCHILQSRLRKLTQLENGMGGAIAVLSVQVDQLQNALNAARSTVKESTLELNTLAQKADGAALRLEMLLASLHDLPGQVDSPDVGHNKPRQLRSRARRAMEEVV